MRHGPGIYTTGREMRVVPRSSPADLQQFNGQETATTFECAQPYGDSRRLHRRRFSERGLAFRRAADVHADGAAAIRGVAIGLVGGDGLLPVDAACWLCVCPPAFEPAKQICGGLHSPRSFARSSPDA